MWTIGSVRSEFLLILSQVTSQIGPGRSLLVPQPYLIFESRLQLYDYSYPFDYMRVSFVLATPSLSPRWLSLYLPLSGSVWLAALMTIFLLPVAFKVVSTGVVVVVVVVVVLPVHVVDPFTSFLSFFSFLLRFFLFLFLHLLLLLQLRE